MQLQGDERFRKELDKVTAYLSYVPEAVRRDDYLLAASYLRNAALVLDGLEKRLVPVPVE